jgi:hypothetical protein
MNKALTIHLQGHFVGALHAIQLLRSMRDSHRGEPLGQFADSLLAEIEADRDVLATLIEKIGATPA